MKNRLLLYGGLTLLAIAFAGKVLGVPTALFWILFGFAITLKATFLFTVFRQKRKISKVGLYLILAGVVLIMLSLPFKAVYPIPWLRNTLFYGAITLKVAGVVLLLVKKPSKDAMDRSTQQMSNTSSAVESR
ncbi:MAG: hypothetical protein K9N46_12215 [Candidatus Marinimicrobia bacterium]|nr:hypothetical protein [Candidatus Neomarinimicrobiota bacterium]MCF7829106.1 hypothetical protein [Candidatus Neomarinimicrobiota bacterium]MCF7881495.1 hypothetical protein [Candidatus Neomarinimicrobiota bacterium]